MNDYYINMPIAPVLLSEHDPARHMKPFSSITLARWIFILAAIYGFLVLGSWMFVTPKMVGHAATQQPEIYYGFGSLGLAWQAAFLLIAYDPLRYRPLILVAAFGEKFFFSTILIVIMIRHIAGLHWIPAATADGLLGIAFLASYFLTRKSV